VSEELLAEAVAIGEALVRDAVWHQDRCTWIARPVLGRDVAIAPTLAPLGPSLYGGTAGIGLFLGRLASVTDDARHRDTALAALRHAIRHAPISGPEARSRFGYHSGALGVAWVAHDVAARLGEPVMARESRRILRALAHRPKAPHETDLTSGSAGAIPTLVALGHEDLAVRLGDELVESARPSGDGVAWPSAALGGSALGRPLAGISHGASGMALGLARLFAATGDARYRETALAAFRYERAAFDPALHTWGDLRAPPAEDGRLRVQGRWCHGAPGIGMARALAAPLLKDTALLDEVRAARAASIATLRAILENPGDDATLCCGMGGVIESCWAMDDGLGIPGAAARAAAAFAHEAQLFGREAQERWPGFAGWPTPVAIGAHPGLMQGVAGIGHLALRLHAGGGFPSALVPP
jgi:lantibiotic modifying enzyme